jgi:hypothetical protein
LCAAVVASFAAVYAVSAAHFTHLHLCVCLQPDIVRVIEGAFGHAQMRKYMHVAMVTTTDTPTLSIVNIIKFRTQPH